MPMTGKRRRLCWKSASGWLAPLLALSLTSQTAVGAEHSPEFSARARLADLEDGTESGRASSILLRLRLASRWNRDWSSLVEVDHVATAWRSDHSNGVRFNDKPLVPDVPGTELNQLALRYRFRPGELTLGRQRVEWDDQRFVGSDSFWQQDQTFDALRLDYRLWMSSRLEYVYIGRAHRIYDGGRDRYPPEDNGYNASPEPAYGGYAFPHYSYADHHGQNSHLARLEVNEWDYSRLVLYGLSIDNRDFPTASSHTLGARYELNYRVHPLRYRLLLESAAQENRTAEGHPQPHYYLAELGIGHGDLEWLARYEVLGADQGTALATPLGSSYLFQGFVGAFALTPDTGLEDTSVRLNWRRSPWELSLRYHRFQAQHGGTDFGRELDLELQYKPAGDHTISVRFGDFRADSPYRPDRRRLYADYRYRF